MREAEPAFVLLLHRHPDGPHYDLMFDRGEALATWQIIEDPRALQTAQFLPARRLSDHRRAYLDYEGPVSGNRGDVTRIDRGTYTLLAETPTQWHVRISGEHLRGTFRLESLQPADSADQWRLYRLD